MKATGNCYENCGKWIVDAGQITSFVLVHATATGSPGSQIAGIEFGHAFLFDESSGLVLDITKDINSVIPMDGKKYRALGKVKDEKHYSAEEAREKILETEHWGPWE